MTLNCISCGHALELRDAYDDFDGPVKCCTCGALLTIRTEDGQVKRIGFLRSTPRIESELEDAVCTARGLNGH